MKYFSALLIFLTFLFITYYSSPITIFARTTPADIVNSEQDAYLAKVKTYSLVDKQKLERLAFEIAQLNKQKTAELEQNLITQGEILDEYDRRNNIVEHNGTDGIHRNLFNQTEDARYWLTYAHEAVAYQAAKIYIFNLTSEKNMKGDSLNLISNLESDLNSARQKTINSQQIISKLVSQ